MNVTFGALRNSGLRQKNISILGGRQKSSGRRLGPNSIQNRNPGRKPATPFKRRPFSLRLFFQRLFRRRMF